MVALSTSDVATYDEETAMMMLNKLMLGAGPFALDAYPMPFDASLAPVSAAGAPILVESRADAALSYLRIVAHIRTALGVPEVVATDIVVASPVGLGAGAFVLAGAEQARHTSAVGGWPYDANWFAPDPMDKANHTVAQIESVLGITATHLQQTITTGSIPGGAPPPPPAGTGMAMSNQTWYGNPSISTTVTQMLEPDEDYPGMCGVTSYNVVEGNFFLKALPMPTDEKITKTVQGINDSFESKYEDIGIESLIDTNDKVDVTNIVYQGEGLDVITKSTVSTYNLGVTKKSSIIIQGGTGHLDSLGAAQLSSTANTIVALRVDDVRPFALKGMDIDHEAEWDFTNPLKPTNREYIRHLTPEKQPRLAIVDMPQALIDVGIPSKIKVYYSAIDKTGEVMAGLDHNPPFAFTALNANTNSLNDANLLFSHFDDYVDQTDLPENQRKEDTSGWLVVERTVPDANTQYWDGVATRSLADFLRRPYLEADANQTWTPFTIHAPGGIISLPAKDIDSSIKNHTLKVNPTGDMTQAPFINLEHTPRSHMLNYLIETLKPGVGNRSKEQAYGLPVAIPNTRTPVTQSKGAYHMLNMKIDGKRSLASVNADATHTNFSPLALEQFDIIDNEVKADRHYILVQPKDRERSATLQHFAKKSGNKPYSKCVIELMLMRGRVEEIAPTSGEDGEAQGVALRGRSVLMDVGDSVVERDFNISEGYPMKEIGDIGSPVVSLTMGGLGQGGLDIKATRQEHPVLPGWKDTIIGTNNPSVRNDKQTSTYYASTRALVELPLFPSMFFDVEKRLDTSTNKRSPLPSDKSMEMVVDCTMMAVNRPQMQDYESRYAIDWGLRSEVSAIKVRDFNSIPPIRCMRENAATFTKPSASWSANEDTAVVSSSDNWKTAGAYIEVDSVLPFVYEGGWLTTAPSGGGAYAATNSKINMFTKNEDTGAVPYSGGDAIWDFDISAPEPIATAINTGNGFVVTVGEGILGEVGIRLHIHKMEINGNSHRLYFGRFSNPLLDTTSWDEDDAMWLGHFITSGLPVVMGGWLTPSSYFTTETTNPAIAPLYSDLADELYISGTSITSVRDKITVGLKKLFGAVPRSNTRPPRVIIDPDDENRVLILRGPSMEGITVDPKQHFWGTDDKPLMPSLEVNASYLGLKGIKNDNETLEWVRPQRIKLGDVANAASNFKEAVNELIRRINQAGHPDALNANGGSAFNPPPLFTESTTSTDTGSHMGYVRAFLGGDVESRDGESGTSIVIHSTIPGASSRNFAIWLNNNSPYPYRPTQAVGFGGLLTTNSRSYQLNSFPAPLPLGADGETHVPITTFQGAVHGAVELDDELRLYDGVGQAMTFNTVKFPRYASNYGAAGTDIEPLLPDYDPISQPNLWVERKALDIPKRINKLLSSTNRGLILVDNKHLATFAGVDTFHTTSPHCKQSGVGACCGLVDVQPLNPKLRDKFKSVFYGKDNKFQRVEIQLLDPLLDANGIIFFGGGHTGVTFDISDGTANDYSDFYTHHYSKGPTGYSGLQNLQEIQTSAAVLDFSQVKNEDTAKDNSYAGMHYKDDDCIAYIRLNKFAAEHISDHNGYTTLNYGTSMGLPQWRPIENKYGLPMGLCGDWSNDLVGVGDLQKGEDGNNAITDQSIKPLYVSASNHGDISARGVKMNDWNDAQGICLTKIADKATLTNDAARQALETSPPDAKNIVANGPWSVTFCVKPDNTSDAWGVGTHGNGPILQGIDSNGKPWGVSFYSRQHDQASGGTNIAYNFRVVAHHVNSAAGGQIQATYTSHSYQGYQSKSLYQQITVVKPLDAAPIIYINGVAVSVTTAEDKVYDTVGYPMSNDTDYKDGNDIAGGGTVHKHPRLPPKLGIGLNADPGSDYGNGYAGRHHNLILIGCALHSVPYVTDATFNGGAGGTYRLTHENTMINAGTLGYGHGNIGQSNGANTNGKIHFKGCLAEIGLWKKALSASEAGVIGAKNWD